MKPPRAILFDLDGTLIDSAPDLHAAANVMLDEVGRDPLDLPTVISFIGNGVDMLVERCLVATGGCDDRLHGSALKKFSEAYALDMTTLTRPYPGVISTLETFRAAGIPLGICTNKPAKLAQSVCDLLDLSRYFEVICGALPDQPKKPDPHPLLRCCDLLGASPDASLFVGDSSIDYETARNAGVPFRLFTKGYLHHPLPELQEKDRFHDWSEFQLI